MADSAQLIGTHFHVGEAMRFIKEIFPKGTLSIQENEAQTLITLNSLSKSRLYFAETDNYNVTDWGKHIASTDLTFKQGTVRDE